MSSTTRNRSKPVVWESYLRQRLLSHNFWDDYFKIRLNWNESGKDTGYYSKGKMQAVKHRRVKENDG